MLERDLHYEVYRGDAAAQEFEKIALSSLVGKAGQWFASRPAFGWGGQVALGRYAGAVPGAVAGGYAGAQGSPEGAKVPGAILGGAVGGLAGAVGGQFLTSAGRTGVRQFGRRQLHGLTGHRPDGGLFGTKGMKGLSEEGKRKARVQSAHEMGMELPGVQRMDPTRVREIRAGKVMTEDETAKLMAKRPKSVEDESARLYREHVDKLVAAGKTVPSKVLGKPERFARRARENIARWDMAEQGLTSAPGLVRGLATKPVETMRTGLRATGPFGLAMGAAFPLAMAPGVVSGEGFGSEYSDPGGVGRLVGESLPWLAAGTSPIGGTLALGHAMGSLGGYAQRGISSLAGAVRPQPGSV